MFIMLCSPRDGSSHFWERAVRVHMKREKGGYFVHVINVVMLHKLLVALNVYI
jgi:hypothetical protein